MQVARVRLALWLTAAAGAAAAVAALAAAALWPLDVDAPPVDAAAATASPTTAAATSPTVTASSSSSRPLASYEPAWRAPLRRPLVDPPPTPPAAAAEPARPPGPMVRLVGTILGGDRPRGVFLVGLAGVELRAAGEKVGGADVLAVEANAATLTVGGRTFTLARERNPFNPTGEPPGSPAARSDAPDAGP